MRVAFTKMHGLGNEFIVIEGQVAGDLSSLSRQMCDRRLGVGADGLILLGDCDVANHSMRIINADGSEAMMCGNGLRCVGRLLHERDLLGDGVTVSIGGRVVAVKPAGDDFEVGLGTVEVLTPVAVNAIDAPGFDSWFKTHGSGESASCVQVGNAHIVVFGEAIDSVPLESWGPSIVASDATPHGCNAHFAHVASRRSIHVRTWERGAGLTSACGSGAAAVCVAGFISGRSDAHVAISLPGGVLQLTYDEQTRTVTKRGPAELVFTGMWEQAPPCQGG